MKETNKQEPIDLVEEQMRDLRKDDNAESEESLKKRMDPKFIKEMYNGLKKEIDSINDKPENKKYLEEFKKTRNAYEKRGKNIIDLLKEGLQTFNLNTTTGKSKFDNNTKVRPVDYNNSDIDGRGVYLLLNELGLVKSSPEDKEGLTTQYIQGNSDKIKEGIALNEKQIGENNGLEVRDDNKKTKAINFIKKNENPFNDTIIAVNNNIKHSDGPTSSTHMVYEIFKEEGMIPKEKQQQIEKFVYFVDIAYRLKQRVVGMDYAYVNSTIFGNYKGLNIFDIYDYLEDPEHTGFEPTYNEDAKENITYIGKIIGGEKTYTESNLLEVLQNKHKNLSIAIEGFQKIKNNVLQYKVEDGSGKEQKFIVDIEGTSNFSEDLASFLASEKLGFCKIHAKNNEIFIRSYYDLPKQFGPFATESANTIHGKLTKENIEKFLSTLEGDNEIKEKIRAQFKKNGGMESQNLETKVGERYTGVITGKKDFGIFIEIKKGDNTTSGLLHKSQINNGDMVKYKEGDSINVIINTITPDKKIGFSLAPEKKPPMIDSIKIGQVFEGTISNITKNDLIFVKVNNSIISGLLYTKVPRELIKDTYSINTPIKVKVTKKTDKGLVFETTL